MGAEELKGELAEARAEAGLGNHGTLEEGGLTMYITMLIWLAAFISAIFCVSIIYSNIAGFMVALAMSFIWLVIYGEIE